MTFIVVGFILVASFLIISVVKIQRNLGSSILMIKDSREYYDIIEKANDGEEGYYKITITGISSYNSGSSWNGDYSYSIYKLEGDYSFYGTAEEYWYVNGIAYYYISFSFLDGEGRTIQGETYTYYSQSAIAGLTEIDFVYTRKYDSDGSWDIIQENYRLRDNIDYKMTSREVNEGFLMLAASVAVGICLGFLANRARELDSDLKPIKKPVPVTATSNTQVAKPEPIYTYKVCMYCGSHLPINDNECDSCGAKKFKIVKSAIKK